jgi:hypothetical protein
LAEVIGHDAVEVAAAAVILRIKKSGVLIIQERRIFPFYTGCVKNRTVTDTVKPGLRSARRAMEQHSIEGDYSMKKRLNWVKFPDYGCVS